MRPVRGRPSSAASGTKSAIRFSKDSHSGEHWKTRLMLHRRGASGYALTCALRLLQFLLVGRNLQERNSLPHRTCHLTAVTRTALSHSISSSIHVPLAVSTSIAITGDALPQFYYLLCDLEI